MPTLDFILIEYFVHLIIQVELSLLIFDYLNTILLTQRPPASLEHAILGLNQRQLSVLSPSIIINFRGRASPRVTFFNVRSESILLVSQIERGLHL